MRRTTSARPAVFLDRDGTIIEDRGFLAEPSQVVLFADAAQALRRLQERFLLFLVTNQSGVARGEISLENVEVVNRAFLARLGDMGVRFRDVYVCPHQRSDNCPCTKPRPFFLHKAAREHGVSLPDSFSVGDHPHDVEFARGVGGRGIYVLTGHGRKHLHEMERQPDGIAENLSEAVDLILRLSGEVRESAGP